MGQDKIKEIEHNSHIKEEAEFFWGWSTPAGKLRAQRRAEIIIERLRQKGSVKVLEIGSGTGVFTSFFCKAGFNVHGIDISSDLLKKAKDKDPSLARASLCTADAEKLPYKDKSFDAVVGVCVLHHLDIIPVLTEIKRVLKEGGLIVFSEPNMMNPQLMIQKNIKPIKRLKILGETDDETAFFRWDMKKKLKAMGFGEVAAEPFDFLHPWTPKPLIGVIKSIGSCFERVPALREIAGSLLISAVNRQDK